jgi:hypothetical protein
MFAPLRSQGIRLFEEIDDLFVEQLFTEANIEPIFTNFSRSVVSDQCSTSLGKASVRMKLARL